MESNGKGRLVRRFREAVDGPIIRRLYAKMPTSELAMRDFAAVTMSSYISRVPQ